MKKFILMALLLSLEVFLFAQSQDWRPVRTDGIYMFSIGQEYRALRIDSTYKDADTLHLFGFHEINYNEETRCYNPKGAPWFGKEIINYPDCTLIKNRFNESLVFPQVSKTQWIFYAQGTDTVRAYLTEEKQFTFLGITDSIRIIQLDDGTDIIPPEIWISKNYGMIKTYNLSMYRHSYYDFCDFDFGASIAGIGKDSIGVQNLTSKDVFDFMPGDELHILDYSHCWGGYTQYLKSIISILVRTETKDTIFYKLQICTSSGANTMDWIVPIKSIFDSLPHNPIYESNECTYGNIYSTEYGFSKSFPNRFFAQEGSDSCYGIIYYDKKKSGSYNPIGSNGYYLNGLGGPYHFFSGLMCENYTKLVYYKKDTTEWGVPYNCDSLISITLGKVKPMVMVYPNPTHDFIQIDLTSASNTTTFLVLDALGKELVRVELSELNNTVSLVGLPKGMLFYQILHSGNPVKKGNFVRQ